MGLVWKDNMHPQCQLSRRAWTWAWGPTTPSPTAALKHPTNPDCRLQHSLAALLQNRWLLTGHRCSSEWKNGWPYAPARHSTWRRGCRALARLSLSHRPGILCFHWGPSLCCLPSLQGKNPVCVWGGVNLASSLKANVFKYKQLKLFLCIRVGIFGGDFFLK